MSDVEQITHGDESAVERWIVTRTSIHLEESARWPDPLRWLAHQLAIAEVKLIQERNRKDSE